MATPIEVKRSCNQLPDLILVDDDDELRRRRPPPPPPPICRPSSPQPLHPPQPPPLLPVPSHPRRPYPLQTPPLLHHLLLLLRHRRHHHHLGPPPPLLPPLPLLPLPLHPFHPLLLLPLPLRLPRLPPLLRPLCRPPPPPLQIPNPYPHPLPSLAAKSLVLTLVLLLRFQALRYLGAAATILADLSGSLFAHSLSRSHTPRRIAALLSLLAALFLLSLSWDRTGCSPLSLSSSSPPTEGCVRILPMLLPFLSGFLAFHERAASNWPSLRPLGRRQARTLSLALTTVFLFLPAAFSFFAHSDPIAVGDLGWPLVNTVIFRVILSGNDKVTAGKDFQREFLVTFFCTLLLELVYFPKLFLPGFLFCGFLLWIAVHELGSSSSGYLELGSSDPSESLYSLVVNPIRHILSERKSRKIALFLLINTGYMVVEFVVGFMSNSLGLISDACHMLFDCAALAIGLYASYISRLPANNQFNYGRGRFEVLSGYVNAVLLVLVGALIVLESFERILDPQEISTSSLMAVSIGGLAVNMVGLVFFHEEHHHAHGGGSACSHSHSHSHDVHHHHQHEHQHNDHKIGHTEEHNADLPNHITVSRGYSDEHSHGGHNHHGCNHDNHHHDHKDDCRMDANFGREVAHSNKHGHGHEHEHKCHVHQDHQHQDSNTSKHEHQGLDTHSRNSPGHCSEGRTHGVGDHDNKESHLMPHMSSHAHNHSSTTKEPSTTDDLRKHRHVDHNMEGIFLHVLADTLGSVGVVISTLLIKYKGWLVADPACSIFISIMIISSVIPLLRNSAEILLQRVPRDHEQDIKVALNDLMRIKGVCSIRNVHIWNLTNTEIVGTIQIRVSAETNKAHLKKRASDLTARCWDKRYNYPG